MKRRILVTIMLVLLLVSLSGMTFASHITHYTILNWWNYDAYEYNSSGKIYIDYIYQENGTHNWSGAIDNAFDNLRSDGYSFFIFNEVSSN